MSTILDSWAFVWPAPEMFRLVFLCFKILKVNEIYLLLSGFAGEGGGGIWGVFVWV